MKYLLLNKTGYLYHKRKDNNRMLKKDDILIFITNFQDIILIYLHLNGNLSLEMILITIKFYNNKEILFLINTLIRVNFKKLP